MRVALITDFCAQDKQAYGEEVARQLRQYGAQPMLSQGNPEACIRENDTVIALGGDGTLLRVAKMAAQHKKPLLGINCGHLGFMTGLEVDELDRLQSLIRGDFTKESRRMLSVCVTGEDGILCAEALNELAVSRGQTGHIAALHVERDGMPVARYLADGLLVATPTGSTAYSLSAGGPVVDPSTHCFVLTPICAHSLESRPYVLDDRAELVITAPKAERETVFWSVDGEAPQPLGMGQKITVCLSEKTVELIHLKPYSFYEVLQRKLVDRALR